MVALQLYHLNEDVSVIYYNPNPSYRNYTIDFDKLNKMTDSVHDSRLREAISILTNMDSKKRLAIYDMLKNGPSDMNKLNVVNPEEKNGKNYEPYNGMYSNIKTDFVI